MLNKEFLSDLDVVASEVYTVRIIFQIMVVVLMMVKVMMMMIVTMKSRVKMKTAKIFLSINDMTFMINYIWHCR